MKRNLWYIVSILFGFTALAVLGRFLSSPAGLVTFPPPLPAERAKNTIISYTYGGSMTGEGETVFISEERSYFDHYTIGNPQHYDFTVTPAELDQLYAIMRQKHFERIRVLKSEMVYDGANGTMSVSWDGKNINKNFGDGITLSPGSDTVLSEVQQALRTLVMSKTKDLKPTKKP